MYKLYCYNTKTNSSTILCKVILKVEPSNYDQQYLRSLPEDHQPFLLRVNLMHQIDLQML